MSAATIYMTLLSQRGGGVSAAVNDVLPSHDAASSAVIGTQINGVAGEWTGADSIAHQWYRSGVAISGATALNYTPVDADFGLTLTRVETAEPGGVTAESAATGAVGLALLLSDQFTTDDAAPVTSPRSAEPGPGEVTITDTGNHLSITGSRLLFANAVTPWTNPRAVYGGIARATGRTLVFKINNAVQTISGWFSATTGGTAASRMTIYMSNATTLHIYSAAQIDLSIAVTGATDYYIAIVLRPAGAHLFIKGGSQFTNWTLIWVESVRNDATLYPCFTNNGDGPLYFDNVGVVDLGGAFASDYGIATQRTASASADATITHTANAIVEATWQAATGQTWEFDVRRTDADNRWIVRCNQGGSTIKLIERNAGVETERSSAAQTWTNGTAYRVVVRMSENTIRTFVAISSLSSQAFKNSYTSASFNNTATEARTDKAVTEFISWPLAITGEAADRLDGANFL